MDLGFLSMRTWGGFVPTGAQPSALLQQLRMDTLPAHTTLSATMLVLTSSFTNRKPQGGAETPTTKPDEGRRRLKPA